MGLFGFGKSDLDSYENNVAKAIRDVESQKRNKEEAKRVGNYQRAIKNIACADGVTRNQYDYNIFVAQRILKERKQRLADAKKRLKK